MSTAEEQKKPENESFKYFVAMMIINTILFVIIIVPIILFYIQEFLFDGPNFILDLLEVGASLGLIPYLAIVVLFSIFMVIALLALVGITKPVKVLFGIMESLFRI